MSNRDFTAIADRYRETSLVQNTAADILISLLDPQPGERILDVGCGPGHITKRLHDITGAPITGIDPSDGMIRECETSFTGAKFRFRKVSAAEMDFENQFDIIFCNSTFQWFRDVDTELSNFHRALKPGGRVGMQAPATHLYCPNFILAVRDVETDPRTERAFARFTNPWFFRDSAREYSECFERNGFKVMFSELQRLESGHLPDEAFKVFTSGAMVGYLNKEYYAGGYDDSYAEAFLDIVRESLARQAGEDGKVVLVFNRIFIVAQKSEE
ncbi:MAG: hypothetical protein A2Y33_12745 [Spirochaetes bacterium GWF1_51_8]|nr:MAG: hypothetical protein A2Y33_12745 [Spirochaetes bacterium GWF1_51_8]